MKIKLTDMEVAILQKIAKNPGARPYECDLTDMITYRVIEEFERGYRITDGGKLLLRTLTPVLMNGQNMREPLGFNGPTRKRK